MLFIISFLSYTGFKHSSSIYDVEGAKKHKTIKTHSPVDFEKKVIVPFEELDSYQPENTISTFMAQTYKTHLQTDS